MRGMPVYIGDRTKEMQMQYMSLKQNSNNLVSQQQDDLQKMYVEEIQRQQNATNVISQLSD